MALASLLIKIKAEGAEQAKAAINSVGNSLEHVARTGTLAGAALTALGTVGFGGIIQQAFGSAVKMDSLTRAMAGVSRDAQDLQGQLSRLNEIARLPGLGLEEAVEGSLRLQSAGLSARLAERSVAAFGNALAGAGKGKAELDGITMALSQISSKGTISAEEINQIAERFGGIRKALQGAFGTADTEAIQKMGISAQEAIARIVAEVEKLPSASSGIQNFIDNLGDSIQKALRPLGQGLVEMIEGTGGGIEKLLNGIEGIGRRIGEVFAAIGKSGALNEVLDKLTGSLAGGVNTGPLESIAATILSLTKNLPDIVRSAFSYVGQVFSVAVHNAQEIGRWMMEASNRFRTNLIHVGQFLLEIFNNIGKLIADVFNNLAPYLKNGFGKAVQFTPIGMTLGSIFSDRDKASPLNFQAMPKFDASAISAMGSDRDRFLRSFIANRGPLKSLPDGLNFAAGSALTDGQKKPATLQDRIDSLLAQIEQNTRKTAEASLKEVSTGGERGAPTALELRRAGGIGRASGDYRMAAGYHASALERQLVAIQQDNLRTLGAGVSPARLW